MFFFPLLVLFKVRHEIWCFFAILYSVVCGIRQASKLEHYPASWSFATLCTVCISRQVTHDLYNFAPANNIFILPFLPTFLLTQLSHLSRRRVKICDCVCHYYYTTASIPPPVLLVELHGGALVIGSPITNASLVRSLLAQLPPGSACLSVDYTLNKPYPAAFNDVVAVIEDLALTHPSSKLVLVGDSAGGCLAVSAMLKLPRGRVHGAYLLSPMLSTLASSYDSVDDSLDSVSKDFIQRGCDAYQAGHPDLASSSPFHAPSLDGLPPLLVHTGSLDCFRPIIQEWCQRAVEAKVRVTLDVFPDMPHGYVIILPSLPAAKQSLAAFKTWVTTL